MVIAPYHAEMYYQKNTAATNETPVFSSAQTISPTTCPGVIFPSIPSQKELDDETAKRKKEEKMRLKLNRKKMFSKKGR